MSACCADSKNLAGEFRFSDYRPSDGRIEELSNVGARRWTEKSIPPPIPAIPLMPPAGIAGALGDYRLRGDEQASLRAERSPSFRASPST
jgi:hypothetical protein